MSGKGRPAVLP